MANERLHFVESHLFPDVVRAELSAEAPDRPGRIANADGQMRQVDANVAIERLTYTVMPGGIGRLDASVWIAAAKKLEFANLVWNGRIFNAPNDDRADADPHLATLVEQARLEIEPLEFKRASLTTVVARFDLKDRRKVIRDFTGIVLDHAGHISMLTSSVRPAQAGPRFHVEAYVMLGSWRVRAFQDAMQQGAKRFGFDNVQADVFRSAPGHAG